MRLPSIFTSIILLMLTVPAFGQPKFNLYPDSIRVEFPELNAMVVFEMRSYTQSESYVRNFSKTLRDVLDNVKKGTAINLAEAAPMRIEVQTMPEGSKEIGLGTKPFGEKQLVTIRRNEAPQTTMTIIKDRGIVELLPPGWEVYLTSKEYKVKIYAATFASLDQVPTQDFGPVADAINRDPGMKVIGRKSIETQFVISKEKTEQSPIKYVHPGDQVSLSINAGIGLIRDAIYPELSFKVGFSFKDRFRRSNFRTSLVYNNLFFSQQSTEGYVVNLNSFLSGTFEVNFNRKTSQSSWSGLGVGFLVRKSGDYFKGNTAKFFITHTIPNSRFSMVPEFYLTDDFKKFIFGMTLKYSF